MQHLNDLARLYAARRQQETQTSEVPDVEKIFGEKGDDIFSFDF
jgi:hypothetical protein